ncbi:unnamed protein product [Owenia fusiformis]|uniref:Uncharacterized protein n=1 Tax=Owenia fusiformis TaxID=6347 RepID=A0A8J1THN3_OWEFU|nr:unnamed protein product [Owenia fusiformis]
MDIPEAVGLVKKQADPRGPTLPSAKRHRTRQTTKQTREQSNNSQSDSSISNDSKSNKHEKPTQNSQIDSRNGIKNTKDSKGDLKETIATGDNDAADDLVNDLDDDEVIGDTSNTDEPKSGFDTKDKNKDYKTSDHKDEVAVDTDINKARSLDSNTKIKAGLEMKLYSGENDVLKTTKKRGRPRTEDFEKAGTKIYTLECDLCNAILKSQSNDPSYLKTRLKNHKLRHTLEKTFPCTTCGQKFKFRGDMVDHEKNYHSGATVTCDICGAMLSNHKGLKEHKEGVHGEKKYTCTTCNMQFTTCGRLKAHCRLTHGEAAFTCEICERTFKYKTSYTDHMNRHNNVKLFKCDICEKSFASSSSLGMHRHVHNSSSKKKCETCGKVLASKSKLMLHMRIHTGEKPHKCKHCTYSTPVGSNLKKHVKLKHLEYFYMDYPVTRAVQKIGNDNAIAGTQTLPTSIKNPLPKPSDSLIRLKLASNDNEDANLKKTLTNVTQSLPLDHPQLNRLLSRSFVQQVPASDLKTIIFNENSTIQVMWDVAREGNKINLDSSNKHKTGIQGSEQQKEHSTLPSTSQENNPPKQGDLVRETSSTSATDVIYQNRSAVETIRYTKPQLPHVKAQLANVKPEPSHTVTVQFPSSADTDSMTNAEPITRDIQGVMDSHIDGNTHIASAKNIETGEEIVDMVDTQIDTNDTQREKTHVVEYIEFEEGAVDLEAEQTIVKDPPNVLKVPIPEVESEQIIETRTGEEKMNETIVIVINKDGSREAFPIVVDTPTKQKLIHFRIGPEHDTSNIHHATSIINHGTPNISHDTSNISHDTPNISHDTPNISHDTPDGVFNKNALDTSSDGLSEKVIHTQSQSNSSLILSSNHLTVAPSEHVTNEHVTTHPMDYVTGILNTPVKTIKHEPASTTQNSIMQTDVITIQNPLHSDKFTSANFHPVEANFQPTSANFQPSSANFQTTPANFQPTTANFQPTTTHYDPVLGQQTLTTATVECLSEDHNKMQDIEHDMQQTIDEANTSGDVNSYILGYY